MPTTPSSASVWERSPTWRFLRWLGRWRTIRVVLFLFVCLLTLLGLVAAEENWRGKRAWETFRAEWEPKGERFDLADFLPKPVPADQNFAATPLLAVLLDYRYVNGKPAWRDSNSLARARSINLNGGGTYHGDQPSLGAWDQGVFVGLSAWQRYYRANPQFTLPSTPQPAALDVLAALGKFEPELQELRAASPRPHAQFLVHYEDGFPVELQHLSTLKALAQVLALRAVANLDAARPQEALQDLHLLFRLADALKPEPLLISQLVRIALQRVALQPVWEGLARHRWSDAQLAELQRLLSREQPLEDYGPALRGERAFANDLMVQLRAGRLGTLSNTPDQPATARNLPGWLMPRGWLYQNQVVIDRLYQDFALTAVDPGEHRVLVEKCGSNTVSAALGPPGFNNLFARMLFPAVERCAQRFAGAQVALDEAVIACALERRRLAGGSCPESLEALVPQFLEKLPADVINGQPLKYRRDPDGGFRIYSVGWNGVDDHGTVALTHSKPPHVDPAKGDWVWQAPGK